MGREARRRATSGKAGSGNPVKGPPLMGKTALPDVHSVEFRDGSMYRIENGTHHRVPEQTAFEIRRARINSARMEAAKRRLQGDFSMRRVVEEELSPEPPGQPVPAENPTPNDEK